MESVIKSQVYLINTCCHKILEYLYNQTGLKVRSSIYKDLNESDEIKEPSKEAYIIIQISKFENIVGDTPVIFHLALKTLKSNNHIDALTTNNRIDRVRLLDAENIQESGKAAYEIKYYLELNNKKVIDEKIRKNTSLRSWIAVGISIIALIAAGWQLILKYQELRPH